MTHFLACIDYVSHRVLLLEDTGLHVLLFYNRSFFTRFPDNVASGKKRKLVALFAMMIHSSLPSRARIVLIIVLIVMKFASSMFRPFLKCSILVLPMDVLLINIFSRLFEWLIAVNRSDPLDRHTVVERPSSFTMSKSMVQTGFISGRYARFFASCTGT